MLVKTKVEGEIVIMINSSIYYFLWLKLLKKIVSYNLIILIVFSGKEKNLK